jgi:hypothetical protein
MESTSRITVVVWLDEPHEDNNKRLAPNPNRTEEPPFNLTTRDYGLCQRETLLFGRFTLQMQILDGPGGGVRGRGRIQDHLASWVAVGAIARVHVESTSRVRMPDLA